MSESTVTRAEYVVLACAEIFSGAGEIMASPMSTSSTIGARLARLTTEPDLLITDGEALILEDTPAVGTKGPVEGWMPFRKVFDVVASGRRHVVMGANQLDRHGNQNLSAFGPLQQPKRQMFGVRGAPGNTINHATSYFVPKHSKRVFVDKVDVVCGVGYDQIDPENPAYKYLNIPRVVTNLGVFDFGGPGNTFRALSLHPGVTAEEVAENTSFEVAGLDEAGITRDPTAEELHLIRETLDPRNLRDREVSA
ncbi:CoA-transferase [Rhodococcus sp. IEGM 1318]|uniref:CoA-transferase subunit beta n=1 Tax=Rhodococcus sp. IEGM 1318 TaxID=3082226 RepID=UPI002953D1D8|nr:CoA-transferase [Rhodococcus sp. IEGM 1318]MDV8007840.1 CoA-transferase [Rhodococcus sp. IEGM 1318]